VSVELLVIGTSGLAKEMAQLARQIDPNEIRWSRVSYVAQSRVELGKRLPYGSVDFCDADLADLSERRDVVIGIGTPAPRSLVAATLRDNRFLEFPNLVHPAVTIDAAYVNLGVGNVFCRGVVATCDITIGDFNLFNWNVTVGHDCTIGSCNVINPGSNVSGHVTIGDACLLGTGTQILEHRSVASNSIVGAGSLVRTSITEAGTYVGVPTRKIK
jgi:sugar O-acyltransferase (sialic acid O-acetyltransferase NeuD family)